MKTKWNLLVVFVLLVMLLGRNVTPAHAATGDLDPTFGAGGVLVTNLSNFLGWFLITQTLTQQSDGRIIIGGTDYSNPSAPFAVLERYSAAGILDEDFGTGGRIYPQVPGTVTSYVSGMHTGPEDEIIAAGGYQTEAGSTSIYLARYDSAGEPVAGFGTDGVLTVALPDVPMAMPWDSALQSDGMLLVAGMAMIPGETGDPEQASFLMRLDPADGTLDPTFGSGGMVLTLDDMYAFSWITLQSDGKILVTNGPGSDSFIIYRFSSTGVPDEGFGTNGVFEIPMTQFQCSALAEGPEGKIYLTAGPIGSSESGSNFFLARLNANGTADTVFGPYGSGSVLTDFAGGEDQSCSLLVQSDGKVIVGGGATDADGNPVFALARYTTDGTLDESFGSDGKVITTGLWAITAELALTPGGKLLATGTSYDGTNFYTAVARYDNITGALDTTFARTGTGKLLTDLPALNTAKGRADSAVQSTGRIIVGSDTGPDYVIHRFNADGTTDANFSADTPALPASTNQFATAIVVDQYDRILTSVYGYADVPWGALVRYTAGGALDVTFGGGDGVVTLTAGSDITWPVGYRLQLLNDIAVQSDGGIILSGMIVGTSTDTLTDSGQAFLLRFAEDGTRDTSFGGDGMVLWQRPAPPEASSVRSQFRDIDIAGDDAILAAAYSVEDLSGNDVYNTSIMRYTAAGVLDQQFAEHAGQYWAMQPLPGGAVLAAGWALDETRRVGLLVRYQPGGAFDPGFGTGGEILFPLGESSAEITAMLLQPDGKIVLGAEAFYRGDAFYGYKGDFTVLRLNADGTNDSTFPIITTLFNGVDESFLRSLILTPGDKILATGYATLSAYGTPYVAMAQYDPGAFNDITAPTITYDIQGTQGSSGWYTSDVTLSWTVTDDESEITSTSGCDPVTISSDQTAADYTCTATSAGGTNSETATIQRDATKPATAVTGVTEGSTYFLGNVPQAGCSTTDETSGVATEAAISVSGGDPSGTGSFTATCSGAIDNAGNTGDPAIVQYTVIVIPNTAPVANPGGPYLGPINTAILFDSSGSSDPDGDPLTYAWTFGDGSTGTGAAPTHAYTAAGVYNACLTVNDGSLDSGSACTMAVVYDPSAGFVTGGGWIDSPAGAYKADETLAGKATFGFVSKYQKGAAVPTGNTEFQFQAGGLNFHSETYEWLVVNRTGMNAQFKGSGTVNGALDANGNAYRFMLWAGDRTPDTFRIRIWWEGAGAVENVVYDNGFDQAIGGGNIVLHTGR